MVAEKICPEDSERNWSQLKRPFKTVRPEVERDDARARVGEGGTVICEKPHTRAGG